MNHRLILTLAALSTISVACSDDGSPKTIQDCYPAMYKQAKDLDAALTAAGSTGGTPETFQKDLDICAKKAEVISKYYDANKDSIKASGDEYKALADKNSWNSVSDVACRVFSSVMMIDVYKELKQTYDQINQCKTIVATDEQAKANWEKETNGFLSEDTWNAAAKAAIESGNKQPQQ